MINEMKRVKMLEKKMGVKVPMPNYFYVERYGRCAEEQMDGLLEEIGKKEWFLFKADTRSKEGGLLHNFLMELEKYAKLGKTYEECVLIELSEEIHLEEDFDEFVECLKSLEDKIYFIFTMKQSKNTVFVQKCMEQYFFMRIIEAKEYSVEEQWEAVKNVCEEYRFEVNDKAREYIQSELEKKEWKTEEQVLCRLKNAVSSMVYEGMMETEKWTVTLEMAKKMFAKVEPENKKRAVIGFNQGGLLYE